MVGILLMTHAPLGQAFLATLEHVYKSTPDAVIAVDVLADEDVQTVLNRANEMVLQLDSGAGVLVFTDICGATPANCAVRLADSGAQVELVYGLNLPSLLRAVNYRNLPLAELVAKVIEGGHRSLFQYQHESGSVCPSC
jgi:PTS system mannose-specific IIA component